MFSEKCVAGTAKYFGVKARTLLDQLAFNKNFFFFFFHCHNDQAAHAQFAYQTTACGNILRTVYEAREKE